MGKAPVGAGTFCPLTILVFYIPPCWKCLPAWRNVKNSMGEEHFVPRPCWYFTFLHAGNVIGELNLSNFVSHCIRLLWSRGIGQVQSSKGGEFDPTLCHFVFFSQRKSTENSVSTGKARYLRVYIPGPNQGIIMSGSVQRRATIS